LRASKPAGASDACEEPVVQKIILTIVSTFTGSPAMRKQREGERCDTRRLRSIWACRPPPTMSARLQRRFRCREQSYSCWYHPSRLAPMCDLRAPSPLLHVTLGGRSQFLPPRKAILYRAHRWTSSLARQSARADGTQKLIAPEGTSFAGQQLAPRRGLLGPNR